jgi:hypothetical protein
MEQHRDKVLGSLRGALERTNTTVEESRYEKHPNQGREFGFRVRLAQEYGL